VSTKEFYNFTIIQQISTAYLQLHTYTGR